MNVFFHIGYPRTGSTFLQKNFFEKNDKINYLGPKNYDPKFKPFFSEKKMSFINKINLKEEINYENSKFLFKNLILSDKKINLISSEKFLTFGINYFENLIKIKKLLTLHNKKINFKVFFVIRNQYDALQSYYHHAFSEISNRFSVKNFKELINLSHSDLNNKNTEKEFYDNYFYNNTFNELTKYFNKKDIAIFLYEDLDNNKVNFLKKISEFLSINLLENEELLNQDKTNQLSRNKNNILIYKKYFPKLHLIYSKLYLKKILPEKFRLFIKKLLVKEVNLNISNEEKIKIKIFFKESNLLLEKITGLKLPKEYF